MSRVTVDHRGVTRSCNHWLIFYTDQKYRVKPHLFYGDGRWYMFPARYHPQHRESAVFNYQVGRYIDKWNSKEKP